MTKKQSQNERRGGRFRKNAKRKRGKSTIRSGVQELVIRKLNELTENYQQLQGNYNELTANYINMKKEIETINKGQEEMKI